MSIQAQIKSLVEKFPESIGRPLSCIPYTLRFGTTYTRMHHSIAYNERTESDNWNYKIFKQLYSLLCFAIQNVGFYRDFYHSNGFSLKDFNSIDDWDRVPVVNKAILQEVPLEARCIGAAKGMKINTGGTSGQPLEFYIDNHAFAREWAHMHHIWKAQGYRPQHLKLTFRGKHFDRAKPLRYNPVHNEYVVNSNCPMVQIVDAVMSLPRGTVIRWLHGYPSLVAEFAQFLANQPSQGVAAFRSRLFGVLLGSEYPAPVYRTVIEKVLSTNIVSWYGHSEMAVLARETSLGVYESLPTYGYAEGIPTGDGKAHRLVCTSLHNKVHPFIRYDTGDLIDPVSTHNGSLAFRISEGRVGDFIFDRQGNRHSLTAVIFGRHHDAFEMIQHLQVRDEGYGRVALIVTPRHPSVDPYRLMQGFDLNDLDVDWHLEVVDSPVRTKAGKIRLKID